LWAQQPDEDVVHVVYEAIEHRRNTRRDPLPMVACSLVDHLGEEGWRAVLELVVAAGLDQPVFDRTVDVCTPQRMPQPGFSLDSVAVEDTRAAVVFRVQPSCCVYFFEDYGLGRSPNPPEIRRLLLERFPWATLWGVQEVRIHSWVYSDPPPPSPPSR